MRLMVPRKQFDAISLEIPPEYIIDAPAHSRTLKVSGFVAEVWHYYKISIPPMKFIRCRKSNEKVSSYVFNKGIALIPTVQYSDDLLIPFYFESISHCSFAICLLKYRQSIGTEIDYFWQSGFADDLLPTIPFGDQDVKTFHQWSLLSRGDPELARKFDVNKYLQNQKEDRNSDFDSFNLRIMEIFDIFSGLAT